MPCHARRKTQRAFPGYLELSNAIKSRPQLP